MFHVEHLRHFFVSINRHGDDSVRFEINEGEVIIAEDFASPLITKQIMFERREPLAPNFVGFGSVKVILGGRCTITEDVLGTKDH